MNRRAFILNPSVAMAFQKQNKLVPVTTRQVNQNDTVFISNNKKLYINTVIDDYGECVSVITDIKWYDPITNGPMHTLRKDLFILESDQM